MPTDKERLDWLERFAQRVEMTSRHVSVWNGPIDGWVDFRADTFRAALDQAMKEFP